MFTPFLAIALSKSQSASEQAELDAVLVLARQLEDIEANFEAKINANKSARGEKAEKLSRASRAQLASLAEDEKELASEQLANMQALPSPSSIVRALHSGLQTDFEFWKTAGRYTPPADMPIVQEFVDAKARLFTSLTNFLTRHPEDDA
jgi:hypothetical protein